MASLTPSSLIITEQKGTTHLALALQVSEFGQGEYGPVFNNVAS